MIENIINQLTTMGTLQAAVIVAAVVGIIAYILTRNPKNTLILAAVGLIIGGVVGSGLAGGNNAGVQFNLVKMDDQGNVIESVQIEQGQTIVGTLSTSGTLTHNGSEFTHIEVIRTVKPTGTNVEGPVSLSYDDISTGVYFEGSALTTYDFLQAGTVKPKELSLGHMSYVTNKDTTNTNNEGHRVIDLEKLMGLYDTNDGTGKITSTFKGTGTSQDGSSGGWSIETSLDYSWDKAESSLEITAGQDQTSYFILE